MTTQPTSPEARRLQQGLNYNFGSRQVGVMNVWKEQSGSMVASLAIFDPATKLDETVRVRVGDEIAIGVARHRIVKIVAEQGDRRAWLEIVDIARGPGWTA